MPITPKRSDLLVLIDIQNDFLPGGALAVPGGDEILVPAHMLAMQFDNVVLTQDWHPIDHKSFAAEHEGREPFEVIEVDYGQQVLWPVHCVQGTPGAEIALGPSVLDKAQAIFRKGFRSGIDSYSAFLENDGTTPTGLAGFMRERGLTRAVFAGLALDYCVGFSALDACKLGFEAAVDLGSCRGIADASIAERMAEMKAAGVELI